METPHVLIYIGLFLLLSYAGGKIANYLKAPRVTGYLVIGMLMSPSLLGLFHERLVKEELTLIPVIDREKRVIANLTIVDLLRFLIKSRKH